jgi:uncharacterized protein (TIGR00661 family)
MMKVLYAIQGTGNGHVCRALDIIPILQKKADVDILMSGIQADVHLPFPVKYTFEGLSFIFGEKGGIDLLETYKKSHLRRLLKEINSLPVEEYDLVISDFEPVSAWACYQRNKPCISLSHQAAVLDKSSPQPRHKDPMGKAVMKVYAPASVSYGFHFKSYNENIFTPVIRQQVRTMSVGNQGHYTVYLPAYSDKRIIKILSQCTEARWEIFSKHFEHQVNFENINVFPINNEEFIKSMASSEGVLCGAGFETPAEALFLKKKLLVIPMKNQFEQHCNAAALKEMGVPVLKSLKAKHLPMINTWLESSEIVEVEYPDITEDIIDLILETHGNQHMQLSDDSLNDDGSNNITAKKLKSLTFKKILSKLSH